MSEVKISAEPRTEFGKGGARRTRRAGKVPAVLYGHGEAPKHIALPAREFAAAIRHGGINQIFNISLGDGTETLALPKAIQRDPIKDTFEHVDLLIVRRGERVTVEVPVHLWVRRPGAPWSCREHDRLSITADALHLPEHLEASIEGLEAGSHVTAGDVKLPDGVELAADAELILAVVTRRPDRRAARGRGRRGGRGRGPRAPRPRPPAEADAPRRRPKPRPDRERRDADVAGRRARQPRAGVREQPPQRRASRSPICWPAGPGPGSAGTGGPWPRWPRPGSASASTRPPVVLVEAA